MDSCQAFHSGRVGMLPVKKAPTAIQERHFDYIYLRHDGQTAIRRRGPGDIWQGLYEPLVMPAHTASGNALLIRKGIKHQLTHRLLIADFYLWEPEHRPDLPEGYFWIKETELDRYGKPRLFELLWEEILRFAQNDNG